MPRAVKGQGTKRAVQPNTRAVRISTRGFKNEHSKAVLSEEGTGNKFTSAGTPGSRTVLKVPLSEVTANVGNGKDLKGKNLVVTDARGKLLKAGRRTLSDSSVAGISQGSFSGYSTTVLKVEAFDILHRLLNVCCKTASLDVLDASKILQQITPEIMNTVVQMLGENIGKGSDQRKRCTQRNVGISKGIMDKRSGSIRIDRNDSEDSSGLEIIQPRQSNEGCSSSSLSTAVDVLMSLTAEKSQGSDGKEVANEDKSQNGEGKTLGNEEGSKEGDLRPVEERSVYSQSEVCAPAQTFCSKSQAFLSCSESASSELMGTEGVIDVTDSVFKTDTLTTTAIVTASTSQVPVMDPFVSPETSGALSQHWVSPFQYGVARGVGVPDKHLTHDDLNLLPNIQSILNPVSPLSGVPEMNLNIPGAFPPLACEGTSVTVKGDHLSQGNVNVGQRKTSLRTILPKPASGESNLRTGTTSLPVQPHRSAEHVTTSGISIPLATFIPTMSYAEQTTASTGVTIKSLPLLTTNPLLINPNNFSNILNTISGHGVIYDPSALASLNKIKDGQLLSTSAATILSNAAIAEKSTQSTQGSSLSFPQGKGKLSSASVSAAHATSVTYTGELKGKLLPDLTYTGDLKGKICPELGSEATKEGGGSPPQKTEKGSNLEAASALLSMGSRNKDSKNGHQVVTGFNRQRHTFDIEEQSLGHRGDILFTSTGTFQIEDIEIDPKKNKIEKDNYACGKCGRVFTSIIYLARHIKRVCPDMSHRKWKCDRCEKAFRHPFGLQQHIYTHTGERPYKCEQCSKAFYSANDLRRHKRTHSGERPYRCSHCDKAFSTTISLKTHTYIHTGERPHKCPVCGKTFATSSKLSRHVVTHSDQRPFACDLCPKTFNRSGDLRRHYNHVHQQEHGLMECDECNKVFATSKCLLHHKGTHNRDRPQDKGDSLACDQEQMDFKVED